MKMKDRICDYLQSEELDRVVTLGAWVRTVRKSRTFSFLGLSDGSSQDSLQVVVDEKVPHYERISSLRIGSCIQVTGLLVKSQGKNQGVEIQAHEVEILGESSEDYPLQKKKTSLEFLRDVAHVRARTNTLGAVARLRHTLAMATHQFFDEHGFYYLNSPILTTFDGEGAGKMFHVTTFELDQVPRLPTGEVDYGKDYFGRPVNLCVTGQLEAEAYALSMGRVYTFGPTFRAENSNTPRHLSEFWMVEPEVAFCDLQGNAELADHYLRFLIESALKKCSKELEFFTKNYSHDLIDKLTQVLNSQTTQITYTDAIEILKKSKENFTYPVEWGVDLQTEHERYLCEKHVQGPVIVVDYPKEIKAFYMRLNDDDKTVAAMDLLVPHVGEIIGGSQREERYDLLESRLLEHKLQKIDYQWYLDLRRFGGCIHSGFGLGFERVIRYISGMENIRDVIPFPRTPNHCAF